MKISSRSTHKLALATLVTALAASGALAQHAGHGSGQRMGGMGGKGMHAGGHAMGPGAVMEMCDGKDSMPPRYCAPHYHVMSSVPGAAIGGAEPMGDKALMVTLKRLPGAANPALVIVGGGGDLAGATTVAAGWKDGAMVHVDLTGEGSLYRQRGVHLHLFPLTGK
ncbi:MAG TPA: hypothetical protein VIS73_14150 [Rhodocyclaceae bacterium]